MVAALNGVRAAEALCSNLTAKVESLARDLAEAKNELSDAAIRAELDGNEESYRAAETEIERLSHALQRAKTAQPAATQRLLDARRALHVLSRSGLVKTFTRLCGARSKAAGDLDRVGRIRCGFGESEPADCRRLARLDTAILCWRYRISPMWTKLLFGLHPIVRLGRHGHGKPRVRLPTAIILVFARC